MNVGQVLESHLGYAARWGWEGNDLATVPVRGTENKTRTITQPSTWVATPVFDGAHWDETESAGKHPTIKRIFQHLNPESVDGVRLHHFADRVRAELGELEEVGEPARCGPTDLDLGQHPAEVFVRGLGRAARSAVSREDRLEASVCPDHRAAGISIGSQLIESVLHHLGECRADGLLPRAGDLYRTGQGAR